MPTDRQIRILQYLTQGEPVEVERLSESLGVSPSTVRRELRVMNEQGLLVRVRGAAKLRLPIHYEPPFESRAAREVEAKRMIAAAARQMVQPGMVVGISGGTTCTELARQLRTMERLTVVTNALNTALEMQHLAGIRVLVTGGMLRPDSYELAGALPALSLQSIHLDLAFIGCTGIDPRFGICVADEPEAMVARALMSAADATVVLADHTKIGRATFARLCPLADVALVITDPGISPEQLRPLEKAGLRLQLAEPAACGTP